MTLRFLRLSSLISGPALVIRVLPLPPHNEKSKTAGHQHACVSTKKFTSLCFQQKGHPLSVLFVFGLKFACLHSRLLFRLIMRAQPQQWPRAHPPAPPLPSKLKQQARRASLSASQLKERHYPEIPMLRRLRRLRTPHWVEPVVTQTVPIIIRRKPTRKVPTRTAPRNAVG